MDVLYSEIVENKGKAVLLCLAEKEEECMRFGRDQRTRVDVVVYHYVTITCTSPVCTVLHYRTQV